MKNCNLVVDVGERPMSVIPHNNLTVTGDKDRLVRDIDAKRIFKESRQVPLANKNYVMLVSDDHGQPALTANHMASVACAQMPEAKQQARREPVGPLRARLRQQNEQRPDGADEMPDFSSRDRTLDALGFYGTW